MLLFSLLKHQSHLPVGRSEHPKHSSLFSVIRVGLASKIAINVFGRYCINVYTLEALTGLHVYGNLPSDTSGFN